VKKFLAVFIILLASILIFTACGKSSDNSENKPVGAGEVDTGENLNSEEQPVKNEVKEYKADVETFSWDGKEFKVLVNPNDNTLEWRDVDFTAEEQNGEPINDAVYNKNLIIEEMFNIKIIPIHTDPGSHVGNIRKAVKAGDNAYDLTFNSTFDSSILAQEGILYDLFSVSNIDLSDQWWDQNAVKDLSIMNKLYYVTGDIGTMYKKSVGIILFNKQMMQDYALGNPYQLVEEKKWTMDKFLEMCTAVSQDLDSNGKWDDN